MVLQVVLLMWLRTTINVQMATGASFFATVAALYAEGGVGRFYRGAWVALLSAPLSRFGDTAANEGVAAAGPLALFDGCVGAALATLAGHYPWFAANNVLEARVPDWGPRRTHARRALIGFACSAVSDTTSNSIRVVKVYVQTAPGRSTARRARRRGPRRLGLLFSGLPAKLLCNGVSSVVFSVIWKTLMDGAGRARAAREARRRRRRK
ncbi:mitochondrial carrier protein [Aureococcus anophagefferens]|nr:mitochondrial carrier protein [Aureococcus anophagefferens]